MQRSEGPSARPGWEAAAPTACPGPLRVVWRINGKVGLGAAGPQVYLRRTRWRRAAAQARPQHDGQAGAPYPPQVHLVKQTPRGGRGSPSACKRQLAGRPALTCPQGAVEPKQPAFYRRQGHGGRQDARRQKRAWRAWVPRKDGLYCRPQQRELARSRSQPGIVHGCVIRSE